MDRLKMHTPDMAEENFKKLAELFPNAVTEKKNENGEVVRAIDADILRQEISAAVVEGPQERYQFTWPDKKKAIILANTPIAKTLRLDREKSVGRDGTPGGIDTENIYIEGDNLDALKLLQETYLGKVKMIYIDPPYNTGGKDNFIYMDNFSQERGVYMPNSGQFDEVGNRLVVNLESNGRFHTDWLNMLYPRLRLAKDLLTDNGAIFVSIDDNEQTNMKNLLNEIFGESNKVAELIVIRAEGGGMAKQVIKGHDYLYVYAKNIRAFAPLGKPKDVRGKIIEKNGERFWIQEDWLRKEFGNYGNCHYEEIAEYKGQAKLDEINQGLKHGKYMLILKPNGMHIVGKLRNLKEDSSKFYSILKHLSAYGEKDLQELNMTDYFSYPKPVSLLKEIIYGITLFSEQCGDIVLDFFSGSATTAHAVMQLNAEDGGNRKFIMVQIPEACDEKKEAEAYKAGYRNVCEIGEERIRRAGKKIKEKTGADIDYGFRVFRVDSSNMEDVYYRPDQYIDENGQRRLIAENIKPDRTPEDLLIQVMLDMGVSLSSDIEESEIGGKRVFSVAGGYLIACFDSDVTEETVKAIAQMQPRCAVFRDSGMAGDSVIANFEQIFETYSPKTQRKVL